MRPQFPNAAEIVCICGGTAPLIRSTPHPEAGLPMLLNSYECLHCGTVTQLAVDDSARTKPRGR